MTIEIESAPKVFYEVTTKEELIAAIEVANDYYSETFVQAQHIISIHKDEIIFTEYYDNNPAFETALPWIIANIVIEGNGVIFKTQFLNPLDYFRFFRVNQNPTNGSLTLKNLTLQDNNLAGTGISGAVYGEGGPNVLTLENCTLKNISNDYTIVRQSGSSSVILMGCVIDNCSVLEASSPLNPPAIVRGAEVLIIDSKVTNLASMTGPVAVAFDDEVVFKNTVFENNALTYPLFGSHLALGENLSLQGCQFLNNTSSASLGLILGTGGSVTMIDCYFEGNHVDHQLIYPQNAPLNLAHCQFVDNTSDEKIIWVPDGNLTVNRCLFQGNKRLGGLNGGGVFQVGGNASIVNSDFRFNEARLGGAIYVGTQGPSTKFSIDSCVFEGNIASNVNGYGYDDGAGGALYFSGGDGEMSIVNCKFVVNKAGQSGGAIHSAHQGLDLSCSDFIGNSVTGPRNGTDGYGAAIYLSNSAQLTASDLSFFNNQVLVPGGRGGALYSTSNQKVAVNRSLIFNNKAPGKLDGIYNNHSTVRVDARENWWGSDDGPSDPYNVLPDPDGSGDGVSANVDFTPFLGSADLANLDHDCSCDCGCYASQSSCVTSGNPIALLTGEKRHEETDLSFSIPGGTLAFTRTYRQNKQDPLVDHFLGLGWSHNHVHTLDLSNVDNIPLGEIVAHLAGGEIKFIETASGSNRFEATPGSTSFVEFINNEYILTSGDKSQFIFNTSEALIERLWPSGMRLVYEHNGPGGKVSRVYDPRHQLPGGGYRELVFNYYSSGAKDGFLQSVTDHSGRSVGFDYAAAVGTGQLLVTITDVNGKDWTYVYYGTGSTENWLQKRVSPPVVDKNGDGSPDTIDLEELIYTLNGSSVLTEIQQQRGDGLLTTDFAFPNGISGAKETVETIAGSSRTHHFTNGVFTGTENALGQRGFEVANDQYRPAFRMLQHAQGLQQIFNGDIEEDIAGNWVAVGSATLSREDNITGQVYNGDYSLYVNASAANGGARSSAFDLIAGETYELTAWVFVDGTGIVDMQIPGVTGTLATSTKTGEWELLSKTFTASADSTGNHLRLSAKGSAAQFYVDDAAVRKQTVSMRLLSGLNWGRELIDNGDIEAVITDNWSGAGGITPTRSTEQVFEGIYSLKAVAGNGQGVKSTAFEVMEGKRYQLTAQVYVENAGLVKMHIPNEVDSEVFSKSNLNNAWQPLTVDFVADADNTAARLRLVANGGAATFYVDGVSVTAKDSGHQVNSVTDALGYQTQFGYDAQERLSHSIDAEGRKTVYVYNDPNYPRLATEIKVIDTDHTIKQWQKFTYDTAGNVTKEQQLDASSNVIQEIRRAYYGNGYGEGFLKSVTQVDLPDQLNNQTTSYFYDALGRVIQTNQSSSLGSCTKTRTIYDPAGNVVATLCNFDLDVSGTPSAGAGAATAANAFDENDYTYWLANTTSTWLQYDFGAGNARTINQMVLSAPRDPNQLVNMPKDFTLEGSDDPLSGWTQVASVSNVINWKAGEARVFAFDTSIARRYWRLNVTAVQTGGTQIVVGELNLFAPDYPATQADAMSLRNDTPDINQNRLTLYEYDAMGRQISTVTDSQTAEARESRTIYDSLSRVILSVSNYQDNSGDLATWAWNNSLERWEYESEGSTYAVNHGADGTENRPAATFYNDRGQVWKRIDPLGTITLFGYDDAGRQVKVVRQASDPTYWDSHPTDYALKWYTASGISGKDLISQSVFDEAGNLVLTIDEQGNYDFTIFDDANRVVKTVRRAKPTATILKNLGDVDYLPENDPRSSGYVPLPDPDQDLITLTEYDAMGRVIRSRDEVGTWTLYGYDALGRQVRTIASASQPFYDIASNPSLTLYDETLNPDGYLPSTAADEDIVAETVYDDEHRVEFTAQWVIDPASGALTKHLTRFGYDGLGRQVRTVNNYDLSGSQNVNPDPATWFWNAAAGQWRDAEGDAVQHGNDDENIITQTVYDSDGRVLWTRDVLGRVTHYGYDTLGRRVRTVTNYVTPPVGVNPAPIAWVWNDNPTPPAEPRWEDGTGNPIPRGANYDENVVNQTAYDAEGRVQFTRNELGNVTRFGYDAAGRRTHTVQNYDLSALPSVNPDPATWTWQNGQWKDPSSDAITHGTDADQNLITQTVYDTDGRAEQVIDTAGNVTRYAYDDFGRRVKVVNNYVAPPSGDPDPANWVWNPSTFPSQWEDGGSIAISHGTAKDENLISETVYDPYGRISFTRDVIGTQTAFEYDQVGRRVALIQAAGHSTLETTQHTVFDKAGRVLRVIRNSTHDGQTDPPLFARDELGNWLYNPTDHGPDNDLDLITEYRLDKLGRVIETINPVGDNTRSVYDKDGRVLYTIDPMGVVHALRYDGLRRLVRAVANFVSSNYAANPVVTYADPSEWVFESGLWKDGPAGNVINHSPDTNTDNADTNIIAVVTLDKVGRKTALQDPRGNTTEYAYDLRNRRTLLKNPLDNTWNTTYTEVSGGNLRIIEKPPIYASTSDDIKRTFDRAGRLSVVRYTDGTPDVLFTYDALGNRVRMRETVSGATVRDTDYTYDKARRMIQVDLDRDGAGAGTAETVKHTYNVRGMRTQIELPGGDVVVYNYDSKGRLITVDDWGSGKLNLFYDGAGRLLQKHFNLSPDDLYTDYLHDPAGRLISKKTTKPDETLASYEYKVDARGNRTQAVEAIQTSNGTYVVSFGDDSIDYDNLWGMTSRYAQADGGGSDRPEFKVTVLGKSINLKFETDSDGGKCNILVNGTLKHTLDTYSGSPGDVTVNVTADDGGPNTVLVRGLLSNNPSSSGHTLRFVQLDVPDAYDLHTVQYEYDAVSRLLTAEYLPGENLTATALRKHAYVYDVAGNRTEEHIWVNGTLQLRDIYSYNLDNRMISRYEFYPSGFTYPVAYDDNGRMTSGNGLTYTWDAEDRLLSAGGVTYTYNGLGQRIGLNDGTAYDFIVDTQAGLPKVVRKTWNSGASKESYVHGPDGILRRQLNNGNWYEYLTDGLGSVRQQLRTDLLNPINYHHYEPYGEIFAQSGSDMAYNFTGESLDSNGLLHLRARYYNPAQGAFLSLDPVEGGLQAMSALNRYGYVGGNVPNKVDPSGLVSELPPVGCSSAIFGSPCHGISEQTGDILKDGWITKSGICVSTRTYPWDEIRYPEDYTLTTDKNLIANIIQSTYGIQLANINQWSNKGIQAVARGIWVIARALETVGPGTGEEIVKRAFGKHNVSVEWGAYGPCNLGKPPWAQETGCVPPPGLGGSGDVVYMPTIYLQNDVITRLFVHEMGHVFDFINGSTYALETFDRVSNPSTALFRGTGSQYRGRCAGIATAVSTISSLLAAGSSELAQALNFALLGTEGLTDVNIPDLVSFMLQFDAGNAWGACIASQLVSDYDAGGDTTTYGETNHFEDFAETWFYWIVANSGIYHGGNLGPYKSDEVNPRRSTLMDIIIEGNIL